MSEELRELREQILRGMEEWAELHRVPEGFVLKPGWNTLPNGYRVCFDPYFGADA